MWYMCKMKYNTVKNDHLLTKEAQQKSLTGKKKKKRQKTGNSTSPNVQSFPSSLIIKGILMKGMFYCYNFGTSSVLTPSRL